MHRTVYALYTSVVTKWPVTHTPGLAASRVGGSLYGLFNFKARIVSTSWLRAIAAARSDNCKTAPAESWKRKLTVRKPSLAVCYGIFGHNAIYRYGNLHLHDSYSCIECSLWITKYINQSSKARLYRIEWDLPECLDFGYSEQKRRKLFLYQQLIQNATTREELRWDLLGTECGCELLLQFRSQRNQILGIKPPFSPSISNSQYKANYNDDVISVENIRTFDVNETSLEWTTADQWKELCSTWVGMW